MKKDERQVAHKRISARQEAAYAEHVGMDDTKVCEKAASRSRHAANMPGSAPPAAGSLDPAPNGQRPPGRNGALDWSITAPRCGKTPADSAGHRRGPATGSSVIQRGRVGGHHVGRKLMRYHPRHHGRVLAARTPASGRTPRDTFGGLRFVRNRMGYDTDPADFIQPLDSHSAAEASRPGHGGRTRTRARDRSRRALGSGDDPVRDYQSKLAGQPSGTFRHALPSSA